MAAIEQPVNKTAFARTYKETNDLSTEAEDNISFQELYYWPNIDCIYNEGMELSSWFAFFWTNSFCAKNKNLIKISAPTNANLGWIKLIFYDFFSFQA